MTLRIVLLDYSVHAFPLELARSLAARGHSVLHLWSAQFPTPLARGGGHVLTGVVSEGITLSGGFDKQRMVRRWLQERAFGRLAVRRIARFGPDIVLSANSPIDVQRRVQDFCRTRRLPFVLWLQDFYSLAITRILGNRLAGLGALAGLVYRRRERDVLRRADAVVAITPDFVEICARWGVERARCQVVENWAPLDEILPCPRDNAWAREHGLTGRKVVLYAGTLGFKHDPAIFLRLAETLPESRIVVVSEGAGAAWLIEERARRRLDNLLVLPFQPHGSVSEMLGTADLALAILEPAAGIYSVPSKVLSYLAAGKAIVLSVPAANLAARTVRAAGAGRTIEPGDQAGLVVAVASLLADDAARAELARNARAYAEANFAIGPITDRFEAVLAGAVTARVGAAAARTRPARPDRPAA